MTYYQICWYFLIYSFGGWALEVVYHAVACGKVINRGFLNGPVCPVYGFGVLSVFAMMNTFQGSGYQLSDGMIFLFGVILATAVELIAGWLLDVCFHARWWDYSNKPLNFHGYICLEFSLIWGVAILLVVKIFQSFGLGDLDTTNPAGSTGEVMLAAREAGAYLTGCDWIECIPLHVHYARFAILVERCIFVDQQGRRFVREDDRRDILRDTILSLPSRFGFVIVDHDGFESNPPSFRRELHEGLERQ